MSRANRKPRGSHTRERNKIILIATEGRNKTEKTYFREFNRMMNGIKITIATGNNTDPVGIVEDAKKTADNKGIDAASGDKLYAVFDTDFDKIQQIQEARSIARENDINVILSNPCFEVWILLHFQYSTHPFRSNNEVFDELIKEWPEYKKNISSFQSIQNKRETAITNAEKLIEFHQKSSTKPEIEYLNPATEVHELVKEIIGSE